MRQIKWYGWIPDLPDHRDYVFAAPVAVVKKLPARVDLREKCPAVYDQGELGSCTANAIAAAHQFDQIRQENLNTKAAKNAKEITSSRPLRSSVQISSFVPSRLFIYYNERVMEGTVDEDSGASIRDGIKSIAKQGVCPESDGADRWPYVISKYRTKPPVNCYKEALDNQALTYYSVRQSLSQMTGCLAAGFPFVFGFSVYESFEWPAVAKTGRVYMPEDDEQQVGGHAVMAVGYDQKQKRFIVRNSWGARWGMKGYFTMPYDYLLDPDLAADFWTVRLVE
jgi:C1A family cysteine protease